MDIIRSSVPSPFAVPVITKSKKPTASDLNEYLQLYVQRPIVPEPVRASFNAGLGSLLLERQPNYLAKPVIGPTASIFPLRTGGPQAPFRSRLGALPVGFDLRQIAFDDAALAKYASIMSEEEMLKVNSLRASEKRALFDFKAALAAASAESNLSVKVPPAPAITLAPAAPVVPPEQSLWMRRIEVFKNLFATDATGRRGAQYADLVSRFAAKSKPELVKLVQSGDLKMLAEKIREAVITYLYLVAVYANGGELPAGIEKSRFESDMNASAIDTMAYFLFGDDFLRLIQKSLTVGFVDEVNRKSAAIIQTSRASDIAAMAKFEPVQVYYKAFVSGSVDLFRSFNAEKAAEYVAFGSIAASFLLSELLEQALGYVPYTQYSQEAAAAQIRLDTAQTEYDALKASLELKIAELGTADTQLSDVRAQLADKIAELASVIADREQNYIAKASLEAAGYVSKADLAKAQLDLDAAVNQYKAAAAALAAATADHTKVKADFDAYKRLVANDYMLKSACKVQPGATFGQRLKALFSRK
jgi:hypothetical protein